MGIMQAELQEKRQWVSKDQFLEGLSLVNLVPGATATQLGIFLGHARGGWRGSVLAGLCFVVPAFCIMLVLATTYAALGATPFVRGGLYGLGPVVLGIFVVAVYRTQQEFIDGLALSQFTPGPILMVAAYVGYKVSGVSGAAVAATAVFLPSFVLASLLFCHIACNDS